MVFFFTPAFIFFERLVGGFYVLGRFSLSYLLPFAARFSKPFFAFVSFRKCCSRLSLLLSLGSWGGERRGLWEKKEATYYVRVCFLKRCFYLSVEGALNFPLPSPLVK